MEGYDISASEVFELLENATFEYLSIHISTFGNVVFSQKIKHIKFRKVSDDNNTLTLISDNIGVSVYNTSDYSYEFRLLVVDHDTYKIIIQRIEYGTTFTYKLVFKPTYIAKADSYSICADNYLKFYDGYLQEYSLVVENIGVIDVMGYHRALKIYRDYVNEDRAVTMLQNDNIIHETTIFDLTLKKARNLATKVYHLFTITKKNNTLTSTLHEWNTLENFNRHLVYDDIEALTMYLESHDMEGKIQPLLYKEYLKGVAILKTWKLRKHPNYSKS